MALAADVCDQGGRKAPLGAAQADAFAEAYARYWPDLVGLCRRRLPTHPHEAEAIAQEAFTRAWASFDTFTADRPFWPWVSTIARRLSVDFLREVGRDTRLTYRVRGNRGFEGPEPDDMLIQHEEWRTARVALASLRARDRRLMELRHLHGWSYEDIAGFEAISVEALRSALRRARLGLRDAYKRASGGVLTALLPLDRAYRRQLWLSDAVSRFASRAQAVVGGGSLPDFVVVAVVGLVAAVGLPVSPPSPAIVREPGAAASSVLLTEGSTGSGGPRHQPAVEKSHPGPERPSGPSGASGASGPWGPSGPQPIDALLGHDDPDPEPGDVAYDDVVAAPDGSVFASGTPQGSCTRPRCRLLYKSTDGGRTWSRVQARGFLGGELLFPPNYPADTRIFSTSHGVQVSYDHGQTFTTVSLVAGPGVLAPDFARGRERIIIGSAPGWIYDVETGGMSFADLSPVTNHPPQANVVFSPSYATDRTAYVGAQGSITINDEIVNSYTTVHRCRADRCQEVFRATVGMIQAPLQVGTSGTGVVWAWSRTDAWRSLDFGETFERVPLPSFTIINDLVVTDTSAYLALDRPLGGRGGVFRMGHGEHTWRRLGEGTPLEQGSAGLAVLPGNRLVAAIHNTYPGPDRLFWSDDDGVMWHAGR